jgi:hypothetical protein
MSQTALIKVENLTKIGNPGLDQVLYDSFGPDVLNQTVDHFLRGTECQR